MKIIKTIREDYLESVKKVINVAHEQNLEIATILAPGLEEGEVVKCLGVELISREKQAQREMIEVRIGEKNRILKAVERMAIEQVGDSAETLNQVIDLIEEL